MDYSTSFQALESGMFTACRPEAKGWDLRLTRCLESINCAVVRLTKVTEDRRVIQAVKHMRLYHPKFPGFVPYTYLDIDEAWDWLLDPANQHDVTDREDPKPCPITP